MKIKEIKKALNTGIRTLNNFELTIVLLLVFISGIIYGLILSTIY